MDALLIGPHVRVALVISPNGLDTGGAEFGRPLFMFMTFAAPTPRDVTKRYLLEGNKSLAFHRAFRAEL